jgi:hypothetical protein
MRGGRTPNVAGRPVGRLVGSSDCVVCLLTGCLSNPGVRIARPLGRNEYVPVPMRHSAEPGTFSIILP